MLKQSIDFHKPLVCLRYGRMSDETQNPRSPDQQFDEIDRERKRLGYNTWRILRDFRDDGVKGAYVLRRPEFFRMVTMIRSGELKVDAVLVDTFERFGRSAEVDAIRHELWNRHGVLVLTADSHFADPTTPAGKALGFVEQLRATTGNEVKAHDVWRGKLDRAKAKQWPGGSPPFGKMLLRKVVTDPKGRQVVDTQLVSDPKTEWIVLKLLRLALNTREGSPTLARMLNDDPEIPEELKPFRADWVAYVLDNPIYAGVYRWANKCTGIRNDTRVQQKNPDGPQLVHDFCPPLITFAEWEQIQKTRRGRGEYLKALRAASLAAAEGGAADGAQAGQGGKQIAALAPGLTLKHLLSGLVVCGDCNSRMTANSGSGDSRNGTRYTYYRCPLYAASGGTGCRNGRYVREDQLRAGVLSHVRRLLFPPPPCAGGKALKVPEWLVDLDAQVRRELARLSAEEPDRRASIRHEIADLKAQVEGLDASLRKPDLAHRVRERYEAQVNEALEKVERLQVDLQDMEGRDERLEQVLDVRAVLERLRRLEDVLAGGNVTDGNAELSLHVRGVYCFAGGRVEMHTCKLGAFAGAVELLARGGGAGGGGKPPAAPAAPAGDGGGEGAGQAGGGASADGSSKDAAPPHGRQHRVKPRRRGRLRTSGTDANPGGGRDVCRHADRFAGLEADWFWVDPIEVGPKDSWAELNARAVWEKQLANPDWSKNRLARSFPQVTRPTVVHALRIARRRWGGEGDGPAQGPGNAGTCPVPPTSPPPTSPAAPPGAAA